MNVDKEQVDVLKENAGFFTSDVAELVDPEVVKDIEIPEEGIEEDAVPEDAVPEEDVIPEEDPVSSEDEDEIELPKMESTSPLIEEEKEDIKIEKIEDVYAAFSDLGYEVKSEQDFVQVVNDFKAIKESESNLKEEVNELKGYGDFLASVPDDLYQLLVAYQKGDDYRSTLKTLANTTLDFTKDFNAHDDFELFQFYFPGKFSNKEDYQESDAYDVLKKAVEDKYRLDKKTVSANKGTIAAQIQQTAQAVNESASQAIQSLGFKKEGKAKIAESMAQGPQGFMSRFVDEKGLWKPESAKLIAKLEFHDETVSAYKAMVSKQQKMLEGFIKRSTGKPKVKGDTPKTKDQEVEQWAKATFPSRGGDLF